MFGRDDNEESDYDVLRRCTVVQIFLMHALMMFCLELIALYANFCMGVIATALASTKSGFAGKVFGFFLGRRVYALYLLMGMIDLVALLVNRFIVVARLGPRPGLDKGSFGTGRHSWIGVQYTPGPFTTVLELPPDYLRSTLDALQPLCAFSGTVSTALARTAVGKAGRIAYIVPVATTFVASLWGALSGAMSASAAGLEGTYKDRLPTRRFMAAARWLRRLLIEALARFVSSGGSWLLRRVLEDSLPLVTQYSITCDASPWGGGGVLWVGPRPVEYCHFTWSEHCLKLLAAKRDNTCQTLFEFLTVFLCLAAFQQMRRRIGVQFKIYRGTPSSPRARGRRGLGLERTEEGEGGWKAGRRKARREEERERGRERGVLELLSLSFFFEFISFFV